MPPTNGSVKPSTDTPATLPRSTRQASSAWRPMVSASLFMTQPPAKTSAVRASTYVPLTDVAGVDVASGVESAPGIKDPEKLSRFFAAVRKADGETS